MGRQNFFQAIENALDEQEANLEETPEEDDLWNMGLDPFDMEEDT